MNPVPDHDNGDSPIDAQLAAPPISYDGPSPAGPATGAQESTPTFFADAIQNKWMVLVVLFLMTGALGIPLLWMNKGFSKAERIIWSIAVTIYTTILVAIVVWICLWAYNRIMGY